MRRDIRYVLVIPQQLEVVFHVVVEMVIELGVNVVLILLFDQLFKLSELEVTDGCRSGRPPGKAAKRGTIRIANDTVWTLFVSALISREARATNEWVGADRNEWTRRGHNLSCRQPLRLNNIRSR